MNFKIQPIVGDASFRNYYRFLINKKSRIIVIAKKEKYKNLVAYCAVNDYLRKHKILSPKLFNSSTPVTLEFFKFSPAIHFGIQTFSKAENSGSNS